MTARRIVLLILILVFLVLPQKSFCVEKPLWEMGIGGGFLLMPDYRGSDETRAYLLPYPSRSVSGGRFQTGRQANCGKDF